MAGDYGVTFQLDSQMDVVINNLKRVGLVDDKEKVQQDLEVLFRTHLGDDIFATGFGLDFAQIMAIGTNEVKIRELEIAARKYKYTKEVSEVSVQQVQVQGIWKEYWSITITLYTGEELKTLVII
jgi:hypothetical protein